MSVEHTERSDIDLQFVIDFKEMLVNRENE